MTNPARPFSIQRRVEELNPRVIGAVSARQAEGEAAWCAVRRRTRPCLFIPFVVLPCRQGPVCAFGVTTVRAQRPWQVSTALTLNGGLARTKSKRPVASCGVVVVRC